MRPIRTYWQQNISFCRLRYNRPAAKSLVASLVFVAVSARVLMAQNTACNSACQYCNAIAAAELVACEIVGDPSCTNRVQGWWQMCLSGAATLPPPIPTPPPEASPTPPSCGGPVLEAAPPTGPQARAAHPEDEHPECAGSNGSNSSAASITLLDPVPDLLNQAGDAIVSKWETLAGGQTIVQGVATDGAARLVIRIGGGFAGQQFTLSVVNDGVQPSSGLPQPLGTIAQTDGSHAGSQITVTARHVWSNGVDLGVMAFAQYFPPRDFSRGGKDDNIPSRSVQLQVTSSSGSFTPVSATITLWRPPLVLVHGLWGSRAAWQTFDGLVNDHQKRFLIELADYGQHVAVSNIYPSYENPGRVLPNVTESALGFAFNAPTVLKKIDDAVLDFRLTNRAAATQADVVAHSMGGTIARTLEYLPSFAARDSFGVGNVHKLITIGTPHLGTPLANQLLDSQNNCLRNRLGENGLVSIVTATVQGKSQNGGVGDLAQGSSALNAVSITNSREPWTAMISGTMTLQNRQSIDSNWNVRALKVRCHSDPLVQTLSSAGWPNVFGGKASDGVVPVSSQTANVIGSGISGVIHSSDLSQLGFAGPGELDANTLIPATVIQILNTPPSAASGFYKLTQGNNQ